MPDHPPTQAQHLLRLLTRTRPAPVGTPAPPGTLRAAALLQTLLTGLAAAILLLTVLVSLGPKLHAPPLDAGGHLSLLIAVLLLLAGPVAGTADLAAARHRRSPRTGELARAGQLLVVAPPTLLAALLARHAVNLTHAVPPPPATAAVAAALAFILLIAERHLAATDERALPEASALRRISFVATISCLVTALLAAASAAGLAWTTQLFPLLALFTAVPALELALRAAGRLYTPPPTIDAARAVAASLAARTLTVALRAEPAGPALRDTIGLDFSRSWAVAFVRAAILPVTALLAVTAWALSGLVLVPIDGRAVYERFGAPVSVLHPGLHAILPWPLGRARALEFGALHEIALGGDAAVPAKRSRAEANDPVEADRLWDQPHPGELTLIIASPAATVAARHAQLFQSVAADLRVIWCVGLTDRAALAATYGTRAPATLLRALAGEVVAASFAGQTLDTVLGADREAMGRAMRQSLQSKLDADRTGLQAVAVIVEAIHPPAGAADAYHAVRAAEIAADAAIYAERGRALTIRAQSRQYEYEQIASAAARAAEIDSDAKIVAIRFDADQAASTVAGPDFVFERYLATLAAALKRQPLMIVDSRIWSAAAPTIDLRPMPGALPTTSDGE